MTVGKQARKCGNLLLASTVALFLYTQKIYSQIFTLSEETNVLTLGHEFFNTINDNFLSEILVGGNVST